MKGAGSTGGEKCRDGELGTTQLGAVNMQGRRARGRRHGSADTDAEGWSGEQQKARTQVGRSAHKAQLRPALFWAFPARHG